MRSVANSAAYRIAFVYSAAIAAGIALLGTIIIFAMHVAFTRQLDATIQDEADTMLIEYHSGGPAALANAIADRERISSKAQLYYAVFSPDGRRALGGLDTRMPPTGWQDIAFIAPDGADSGRALAIDLPDHRRLVITADREWLERIDRTVLITFVIGLVAEIALSFVGALLLGGYLRRRLTAIGDAAEAINDGDFSQRMPISVRHDEFDQLADILNRMLERIELLLDNLRQVSSDVAHDLRTPLARLRNVLEESDRASTDPEAQQARIGEAIGKVDEILALFAAILRIFPKSRAGASGGCSPRSI